MNDQMGGGNLSFDTREEALAFIKELVMSLGKYEYINLELKEYTDNIRLTWEIWR